MKTKEESRRLRLERVGSRLGEKYTIEELRHIIPAALSEHNWHPAARVVEYMLEGFDQADILEGYMDCDNIGRTNGNV